MRFASSAVPVPRASPVVDVSVSVLAGEPFPLSENILAVATAAPVMGCAPTGAGAVGEATATGNDVVPPPGLAGMGMATKCPGPGDAHGDATPAASLPGGATKTAWEGETTCGGPAAPPGTLLLKAAEAGDVMVPVIGLTTEPPAAGKLRLPTTGEPVAGGEAADGEAARPAARPAAPGPLAVRNVCARGSSRPGLRPGGERLGPAGARAVITGDLARLAAHPAAMALETATAPACGGAARGCGDAEAGGL